MKPDKKGKWERFKHVFNGIRSQKQIPIADEAQIDEVLLKTYTVKEKMVEKKEKSSL